MNSKRENHFILNINPMGPPQWFESDLDLVEDVGIKLIIHGRLRQKAY